MYLANPPSTKDTSSEKRERILGTHFTKLLFIFLAITEISITQFTTYLYGLSTQFTTGDAERTNQNSSQDN